MNVRTNFLDELLFVSDKDLYQQVAICILINNTESCTMILQNSLHAPNSFGLSTLYRVSCFFVLAMVLLAWLSPESQADEPKWYPFVVARGPDRMAIQNTPIMQRPYRPMHFYGNAVRRTYYRGNPAPLPRDLARATTTVILRR